MAKNGILNDSLALASVSTFFTTYLCLGYIYILVLERFYNIIY